MLSLAAPWWLLGLLLLPVVRWLHRSGRHRRALPVSHLALWRGAAAQQAAAAALERQPPDPAWRRRALLAALLFTALAGPQWPARQPGVTVWVDDSISMLTQEVNGTRLALGLAQAQRLLAQTPHGDVELRTLSDPWRPRAQLDAATPAALAASALAQQPAAPAGPSAEALMRASVEVSGPPPAALLRRDRLHWLVTDGTDSALLNWPAGQRADRVLQVGVVARNVGLESVSARRSAADANMLDVLVKISNGGQADEARELVVSSASGEQARVKQRLAAGTSAWVQVQVPAAPAAALAPALPARSALTALPPRLAPGPLAASSAAQARLAPKLWAALLPADALTADDTLVLDLAPLQRRRVAVDGQCPPMLLAAVAAHPALLVVAVPAAAAPVLPKTAGDSNKGTDGPITPPDTSDLDAALVCTAPAGAVTVPTLQVHLDRLPQPLSGPVQWSSAVAAAQRVRLDLPSLPVAGRLTPQGGDRVLLAVGPEPVVVSRAGAVPLLATTLDFTALAPVAGDAVPLLVNLLFEQLLNHRLLDATVAFDRGAAASRVVPAQAAELLQGPRAGLGGVVADGAGDAAGPAPSATAPAAGGGRLAPADGTRAVLLLALLVLLWELLALARQGARLRAPWRLQADASPQLPASPDPA